MAGVALLAAVDVSAAMIAGAALGVIGVLGAAFALVRAFDDRFVTRREFTESQTNATEHRELLRQQLARIERKLDGPA